MSKKVLRTVGKVAGVVAGVALIGSGVGAALGGTMMLTLFGGAGIAAGTIATVAGAVSMGASLLGKPKATALSDTVRDRLQVSLDPRTPRKMVLGRTAMATDLRDQEFTGTDKEYLHRFIVVAAHKVNSIQQIWFDDQLAWTSAGGVQGAYSGYLTVTPILQGTPGNAINISPRMGSSRRFTGCAYVHLRFKLTGNSKKTESPFSQQVPTRLTIVGEGIPCYDPRQDSTQPGGSGAHRADDQSTWTWGEHASNLAIQFGTWMLGWRIQNPVTNAWKLSVGRGISPDRIDWQWIMEGANLCDEAIALLAGGTEPRYRGGGLLTEDEDPEPVFDKFKAAMNADIDDVDGLIRLTVFHNDLAVPVADFSEADIEGQCVWQQTQPLHESFNVVRGEYIDPSDRSLYQPAPYTEAAVPSPDGLERTHPCSFELVQSKSQAERLAKQRLQRQLYGGTFSATFLASGWKVQKNSIVRLTLRTRGWENKLFRVAETAVQLDGRVPMVLREEHPDIYAWDSEEGPEVQIAEPTVYLPGEAPIPQFLGTIEEGATVGAPDGTVVGDRNAEDVTGAIDAQALALAAFDADLSAANAAIAAAESSITDLLGDMAAAEAAILASIADIDNLEGTVATLDSTVTALGSTVSTHGTALGSLETNYAGLTQTVRVDQAGSFPSTFEQDGRFWFSGSTGEPASRTPIASGSPSWATFATVSGVGRVLRMQGDGATNRDISQIGAIRWRPGMRLKAVARGKAVSGSWNADLIIRPLDADYNYIGSGAEQARVALGSSYSDITLETTTDFPAGTVWVRATLRVPSSTSGQIEWVSLEFGDVTYGAGIAAQVTTQASAISTLEGNYASLSSTVSTQGSTVTTQGAAITTLQGNYASLNSTVGALGSTVTSQGSAISDLQGNYAGLTQTVRVDRAGTLPSTFEEDGRYWFSGFAGDPAAQTPLASGTPSWVSFATVSGVGRVLRTQGNGSSNFDVGQIGLIRWRPGMRLRAVARGKAVSGSGNGWVYLRPLDANYSYVGSGVVQAGASLGTAGYTDLTAENTADFPAGTVWVRAQLRIPSNTNVQLEWVSLEFTDVTYAAAVGAEVTVQASAISTLNSNVSSLFAKWSVTVDVNDRITGIALNNNGSTGIVDIVADYFRITKPGGGPRTEFSDGVWRIYSATHMLAFGVGFGTSSQFVAWYGPTQANLNTCSETNALYYLKTNGQLFFGGVSANDDYVQKTWGRNVPQGTAPTSTYTQTGSVIQVFLANGATAVDLKSSAIGTAIGSAAFGTEVKWQYSANGSSWSDVSGQTIGGGTTGAGASFTTLTNAVARQTGLTAGSIAYFRLMVRLSSGTMTSNAGVSGVAEAQAS